LKGIECLVHEYEQFSKLNTYVKGRLADPCAAGKILLKKYG